MKVVLVAILIDAYKPAKQRHDDFIKGGNARTQTLHSAAGRGSVSPRDVDELRRCMMRWVLREEIGARTNLYQALEEAREGDAARIEEVFVSLMSPASHSLALTYVFLFLISGSIRLHPRQQTQKRLHLHRWIPCLLAHNLLAH